MTKKGLHIVFLSLICFHIYSQSKRDSLAINFHLEFNKLPFELNRQYISASKDTLAIGTFKCYISNIKLHYDDHSVFIQKDSYHLLDSDFPNSFQIPITKKENRIISKITFDFGIDSLTNTVGAMTGDLDPVKGMYWTWQSGYINMKIEGNSPSCNTRKKEFQFHIGGYLNPNYALRKVEYKVHKMDSDIHIGIDLYPFFSHLKLNEINSVMIPGEDAMKLADYAAKMFSVQ